MDAAKQVQVLPDATEIGKSFVAQVIRGPTLAAVFTLLLEPLFRRVAEGTQLSSLWMFVLGTTLIHAALYTTVNGFFALCDKYRWFESHKLPRTQRMLPSRKLILETLKEAVIGVLIIGPAALYCVHEYLLGDTTKSLDAELPSFLKLWGQFFGCLLTNQIGFYAAHRLLHEVPYLYKTIHKQHHKFVGTVGIAAEYAHPVEDVLASHIPTIGFVILGNVHMLVWFVWLSWRLLETYEAHSGYCFKRTWLSRLGLLHATAAEFHDSHHTTNKGNYGSNIGIDFLLGTMQPYVYAKEA